MRLPVTTIASSPAGAAAAVSEGVSCAASGVAGAPRLANIIAVRLLWRTQRALVEIILSLPYLVVVRSVRVGFDRRRRDRRRLAAERAMQRVAVDAILPSRGDDRRKCVADEAGERAALAHKAGGAQEQQGHGDRHRRHDT